MLLNARRIAQRGNGTQMILLAMEDVTERKQMEKILRDSLKDSRHVSSRALEVHELERKRVAHDIHDGIGQSLLAAKIRVHDALQQAFGSNSEPGARISETIEAILQENVAEIQRLYMGLRPATLDDLGILPTITWSCREFERTYPGIRLETEIEVEEQKIHPLLKTTIYRVMQEALKNVAEHSKADLVHLSLRNIGDKVQLMIKDNGQGFNVKEVLSAESPQRGFGLTSMRERTEISGGVFAVESVKGKGTTITASWKAATAPQ
jgi:signal transduction histidine kinase